MHSPSVPRRRAPRRLIFGLNERILRSWLQRICVTRLGRQKGMALYRRLTRTDPAHYQAWLNALAHQLQHDPVLEQLLQSHCTQSCELILGSLFQDVDGEPSSLP